MYKEYFGIEENPFSITPNPRYLYMSRRYQEALAHLLYGVGEGGGFVLLTGEVGTGKTTVCRCLLEQLPDGVDVALILNPRLNEIELLASICDELRIDYSNEQATLKSLVDLLNSRLLELHAQGRHPVLIIDEAQNLSPGVLEQVRLLTNLETATKKLLQIILVGQPELKELLDRRDLRQLSQRITARFHLLPLTKAETRAYIAHRLSVGGLWPEIFSKRAMEEIHRLADGVPRLINILCDRCMLGAYAKGVTRIDKRIVRESAKEVQGIHAPAFFKRPSTRWALAAGVAVMAIGGLTLDPLNMGLATAVQPWRDTLSLARSVPQAESSVEQVAQAESPVVVAPGAAEPTSILAEPEVVEPNGVAAMNAADATDPGETALAAVDPVVADDARANTPIDDTVSIIADAAEAVEAGSSSETTVGRPDDHAVPSQAAGSYIVSSLDTETGAVVETLVIEPPISEPLSKPVPDAAEPIEELAKAEVEVNVATQTAALPDSSGEVTETSQKSVFGDDIAAVPLETAFVGLFKQWKLNYRTLAGIAPCSRARSAGLDCLNRKGGWARLVRLNRPALISMVLPGDVAVNVVVLGANGNLARLMVGAEIVEVALEQFSDYWTGEYVILWKPPPHYNRVLSTGIKGADVAWFSKRLAQVMGKAKHESGSSFTAELRGDVMAFQKSQSIQSDGIVGAQTLIHLNSASANPSIPLLHNAPKAPQ